MILLQIKIVKVPDAFQICVRTVVCSLSKRRDVYSSASFPEKPFLKKITDTMNQKGKKNGEKIRSGTEFL